VLTVQTFDGFTYLAKIGPKQNQDYSVSFSVTANLPAERAAAKDEKAKLDKAFKEEHDQLAAKFAKEKSYDGWVYSLPAYSVDELLKTRGQLLAEPQKDVSKKASTKP
jgi:hypothetical protein